MVSPRSPRSRLCSASGSRAKGEVAAVRAIVGAFRSVQEAPADRAAPTPEGVAARTLWRKAGRGRLWTDGGPEAQSLGGSISRGASSSTLTSLNVSTFTFLANRAGRYMSQTQASVIDTS